HHREHATRPDDRRRDRRPGREHHSDFRRLPAGAAAPLLRVAPDSRAGDRWTDRDVVGPTPDGQAGRCRLWTPKWTRARRLGRRRTVLCHRGEPVVSFLTGLFIIILAGIGVTAITEISTAIIGRGASAKE